MIHRKHKCLSEFFDRRIVLRHIKGIIYRIGYGLCVNRRDISISIYTDGRLCLCVSMFLIYRKQWIHRDRCLIAVQSIFKALFFDHIGNSIHIVHQERFCFSGIWQFSMKEFQVGKAWRFYFLLAASADIYTVVVIAVIVINKRFQKNRRLKFHGILLYASAFCHHILLLDCRLLNIQFLDLCIFIWGTVFILLLRGVRNEVIIVCSFRNLYIFQTCSLFFPFIRRLQIVCLIRSIALPNTVMKFGIFSIQVIRRQCILIVCFCIRISGSGFVIGIVSLCRFVIFFFVFFFAGCKFCLGIRFGIGIHVNIRCRSGRKESISIAFT